MHFAKFGVLHNILSPSCCSLFDTVKRSFIRANSVSFYINFFERFSHSNIDSLSLSDNRSTLRFNQGGLELCRILRRSGSLCFARFEFSSRLVGSENVEEFNGPSPSIAPVKTPCQVATGRTKGGLKEYWQSEVIIINGITPNSEVPADQFEDTLKILKVILTLKPVYHSHILKVTTSFLKKYPKYRNTPKFESLVKLLLGLGFSVDKLLYLLTVCPKIRCTNLQETILPKLFQLFSFGLTYEQVVIVTQCHYFLFSLSCHNIEANLLYLSTFIDSQKLAKVVTINPPLLGGSITKLTNKLRVLKSLGLTNLEDCIVKCPTILRFKATELQQRSNQLSELLGVEFLNLVLPKFPMLLLSSLTTTKDTYDWLSLKFGVENAQKLIKNYPLVLGKKVTSISVKVDFICSFLDNGLDMLVKNPATLGYSLESRIKPRFTAVRALGVKYNFGRVLSLSEAGFSDYLKKLVEICEEEKQCKVNVI